MSDRRTGCHSLIQKPTRRSNSAINVSLYTLFYINVKLTVDIIVLLQIKMLLTALLTNREPCQQTEILTLTNLHIYHALLHTQTYSNLRIFFARKNFHEHSTIFCYKLDMPQGHPFKIQLLMSFSTSLKLGVCVLSKTLNKTRQVNCI